MHNTLASSIQIQPLCVSESASMLNLFSHFHHLAWAILLDSADSLHPDGRYDIMVAHPIATLTTRGKDTDIHYQGTSTVSQENPLHLLKQQQAHYLPEIALTPNSAPSLPFTHGAMGYFAYDLGRRFETLPCDTPLNSHSPDMAVGLYSWSVIKDNHTNQWYFCSHSDYPAPSIEELQNQAERTRPAGNFQLNTPWQANMTEEEHGQKIEQIHQYLSAGDCYQVNLAQRFSSQYQGDEWRAYLTLRQANRAPFSAFIRLDNCSILSISPERFLSCQQQKVQSKPIKGTTPRHSNPEQDQLAAIQLQQSTKDRAENLMIVDLLRNDMSKNCQPGTVTVPEIFAIESFPAVHHLVSTVEGKIKQGKTSFDLLEGAFPGGSITGAPKIRAMEIIEELEPDRRHIYCGSIGYINHNLNMDTSICIRTLLCEEQQIYCWAGGGIVIDSEARSEYQESLHKVARILPQLMELHEQG